MKFLAAHLLASLNEESPVSAAAIKKILASVGIDATERVDVLIKELNGKNISDLIAQGASKLASVPSGGAVVASSSAAAPAAGKAAAKEEKKEEKPAEESDDDMGFGLFD
jgi:large subunit ribosomal protein LP2